MGRVCSKCKVEKDESEFYRNKRMTGGLDYYCKDCRKKQAYGNLKKDNYKYQRENIEYVNSLKEECQKCGEDRMYLIQFHHVNPNDKKFILSNCSCRSKEAIAKEASKCVCLCSNCHDEFHHFYGKQPKHPVEALMEYLYG